IDLKTHIQPQPFTAHSVVTLNNLQKLLGAINFVRPFLGITTEELSPLFNILKEDPDLASP
ncbi:POK6 protein, partial [Rynchops niger]|nr:POK6 protein [Rynchops niger]NXN60260.1 POK6 protein [Rynchops niger]